MYMKILYTFRLSVIGIGSTLGTLSDKLMKKRIKLKGGDEYDVHTGWRKLLQPSRRMILGAKRSYNKRFRKEGRKDVRRESND